MNSTFPTTTQQASIDASPSHLSNAERNYIDQNFEVISWNHPKGVEIVCPCVELHTTRTSSKNTVIFTQGNPLIHCFHESCKDKLEEETRKLRNSFYKFRINQNQYGGPAVSLFPHSRIPSKKASLKEAAERSKELILENYSCDLNDLRQSSPYKISSDPIEQFRLQLSTISLKGNETFFHGGLKDSGHERNRSNFLTLDQAKSLPEHLGEFISQSAYANGCYQRKKEFRGSRFVYVVECDGIDPEVEEKLSRKESLTPDDKRRNKETSCAIYRWMKEAVCMRLLWVVDSGNKSLHAAFDVPDQETLKELEIILPALGCDSKMHGPNQLTRAAGAQRDGDGPIQELLYCDPVKA